MATSSIPYMVPHNESLKQSFGGGPWVTVWDVQNSYILRNNVRSGVKNPRFRDQILAGTNATTSYSREELEIVPGTFNYETEFGNYRYRFNLLYGDYALPDFAFDFSVVTDQASNILKRKLQASTGQSKQLANLLELRDVPRTIRGAASSAIGLVKSVLESKRRGPELKKYASDAWLSWSFGIKPTLQAVDDAISSTNAFLARKDHSVHDYGISSSSYTKSVKMSAGGGGGILLQHTGQYNYEVSSKIGGGWIFNLRSANDYNLGKHLGLDISGVVPAAWELLPYSWLVDYFTTAGQFISDSFSGSPGNAVYIYQNSRGRINGIATISPRVSDGYSYRVTAQREMKLNYFNFSRIPLATIPRADLRLKTSDEVAHNALTRLLNLTAILGSRKS